ncbi:MAG: hypothetical protein MUE50_20455 [Pirellulaceae bacterium]|jgi:hypothetical protein|nr:hypothetical protein [Pirellulaceae bacterium]
MKPTLTLLTALLPAPRRNAATEDQTMLTVPTRRHRCFAIVALTAVSFALAQQAAAQQRWTNDEGKTITAGFIRIEI